jgi:hypothetical protein
VREKHTKREHIWNFVKVKQNFEFCQGKSGANSKIDKKRKEYM